MTAKVGDRIAVILSATVDAVKFMGYGTLQSSHAKLPPEWVAMSPSSRIADIFGTPEIKLDSGEIVYGFEVYWMPEASFDRFKESRAINQVDVASYVAERNARFGVTA